MRFVELFMVPLILHFALKNKRVPFIMIWYWSMQNNIWPLDPLCITDDTGATIKRVNN